MIETRGNTAVYGHWNDDPSIQCSSPVMFQNEMIVDAQQFVNYWRRCSLSSVFWSRYTSLFVPTKSSEGWLNKKAVESVLAYLLNELFENCAKFSNGPNMKIIYQAWIENSQMIFQLTNHIKPEGQQPFVKVIKELLESDIDELYFQKLEENAENDSGGSGLGFITLMNDYGVQFGYKFQPVNPETVQVDVQAYLSLKEI